MKDGDMLILSWLISRHGNEADAAALCRIRTALEEYNAGCVVCGCRLSLRGYCCGCQSRFETEGERIKHAT